MQVSLPARLLLLIPVRDGGPAPGVPLPASSVLRPPADARLGSLLIAPCKPAARDT